MDPIISAIQEELKEVIDEKTQNSYQRFFKEKVNAYGCKTAEVSKIAKKYWKEVRTRSKQEIFSLCEELYESGHLEETFIVSSWVPNLKDRFKPEDINTFRYWIENYITNWATCDSFCNHSVGDFIEKYPAFIGELKNWTRSENRWMRRAAAVSLIIPAKRGRYLDDVLEIADALLTDEDDMVRKGYGWLLKEASRQHEDSIFEYVQAHKKEMPRTSLRYAIELMPKERRAEAMKKDWK
ncbi:MAG TPA: DNA alkylation repair protein [Methanospirillum sp.]|uniref:DNA alkylation repair protein n=1 Tax=Methanospirillum sp. TaxID=45200 RepID=UPI002CF865A3|nr:DNA alkylation repair protein [Methanospirillum sp.]HOJ96354.1 DNA alkylation repair protein [Methanospirillum sp.]HOL41234.1 DNA alkylation repair protein [Methanospirillum sp.]HPP78218.1 DNA alkylation repair protein [Methanospirillum sp.]